MIDIYNRDADRWAQQQHLDTSLKPLLITIARFANSNGKCWPSQVRLAELTNQCERTVRRKLGLLKAAGFINVEHRHDANRERMTSEITLRFDREAGQRVA